jgi:hypothetical protein
MQSRSASATELIKDVKAMPFRPDTIPAKKEKMFFP